MPAAAFADTSASRASNNEHALAPLRDAEPLRVQYRPRRIEPQRIQRVEDDGEIASAIAG